MLETTSLRPVDASFVVFGSLARDEFTAGSDLDWTLLVDGQADPEHVAIRQSIGSEVLKLEKKEPGPTGLFGGLAFSHDLIHQIGGGSDSNRNTTQRILLLLESRAIGDGAARDRVLRGVLQRYLQEDRGYELHDGKLRVPRFLLNDIVRFWRTLTVDYAAKRRDRDWKGWAIRNFKLRMSRKLIFVAGLTMCLRCQLRAGAPTLEGLEPGEFYAALQDYLIDFTNRSPLDIVVEFSTSLEAPELAGRLLDAYDEFLGILMDEDKRSHLDKMDFEVSLKDSLFAETRRIGSSFRDGLIELFFKTNEELTALTQRHGVF